MPERSPRLRLFDMLHAIGICSALAGSVGDTDLAFDWTRRLAIDPALEIISEASRHLGDDLKQAEPDVPWEAIAGIGNVLRHGYETVSPAGVVSTLRNHLPALQGAVTRLYARLKSPADPWPDGHT